MVVAVITGAGGLVGAGTAWNFLDKGMDIVGIDNDMRARFFGEKASTRWQIDQLARHARFTHVDLDIRDAAGLDAIFARYGADISVVVHCAAQPSHDWAVRDPITDFSVNATGTLNLLEATRKNAPDAGFVFVSSNKVYGDRPNALPLMETDTRFELPADHPWAAHGIPEDMPIDQSLHSLFGASKLSADVLVQEYGRYFGMKTVCFRGGCLTGPGHSGAELHGFLAYLMRCAMMDVPYTVFGYRGKQVRDNLHVHDLVDAFWCFLQNPRLGAVFNIGGGRHANCSILEAIAVVEDLIGRPMLWRYHDDHRRGDHKWWVSDTRHFQSAYPAWRPRYDIPAIMRDIQAGLADRLRR